MIVRLLFNPTATQTTKKTLGDECCDNPDFNIWTAQGRYRGAKKDSTVFCVNCNKDILTLITR